MPHKHEVFVGW